jgi:branched-chain amino acid transport system permease protein
MSTAAQVLVDGIVMGGFYALMAQGLSLIFGVMRVINLAHGEMLLLGSYLTWAAHEYAGIDALVALPIVMLVGYAVGWLVARSTVLRVVERPQLMALLLTFGLAFVVQGLLVRFFSTTPRLTSSSYSDSVVDIFGLRVATPRLMMLVAALVVLGLVVLFLNRTRSGKAMKAAAQNKEAARIVGININRTYAAAFGLGTALAFGAGVLFSTTQGFTPAMGPLFTLKAFVIVVLGGTGRLGGTFAAAMFVGLVEAGLASYVPNVGTGLGIAAAFVMVVVALAIRPQGISGQAARA